MCLEFGAELGAADALARDDQDRVLARDGAEDQRVPGAVDRLRQRLREPGRRRDQREVAARLTADHQPPERPRQLAEPVDVRRAGRRVDEAAAGVPDLDEPELVDVARHSGLDDCVTGGPQRLRQLGLRRDRLLPDQAQDQAVPLPPVHGHASTPSRIDSAWSTSASPTTSGGARRSVFGPAVRTTRPSSRQVVTRSPAGCCVSMPISRPAPRTSSTPGSCASRPNRVALCALTFASSASSTVSTTAQAAAHETGFPPKVEPWSPGANALSPAQRRAPIGSPFASALASVTRSGRTPSCSNAKKLPVRPTPTCTSSKQRIASSARAAARNSGVNGITPPSPSTGSSSTRPVSSPKAPRSESTSFGRA